MWFLEHGLDLPTRRNNGNVVWRRPNYATIHRMIENPIYGVAYAYGRTRVASGFGASAVRPRIRRKPREEWLALIPDSHEGYVGWERAEAIRKMVSDNVPTGPHHGAPKHGDAAARRACPLPALRSQADGAINRRQPQHPALFVLAGSARQWRAALHRLRRVARR
jgi:Recombinase